MKQNRTIQKIIQNKKSKKLKKKRFIHRRKRKEEEIKQDDIHIEDKKDQTQTPKLNSRAESSPSNLDEFSSSSIRRVIPNTENKSIAELNRINNEVNLN